jgi:Uma2 family endonuclease
MMIRGFLPNLRRVLHPMSMPSVKRVWTVADLSDLPDDGNRYEVVDGELYVTPAQSFDHQAIAYLLARLIGEYLDREPVGYVFLAPADVTFSPRRNVQPDVFVVPPCDGRRPKRFEDVGHLMLAAEVLSPSTGRADRVAKRTVYREEGVDVYWVIDPDARTFERSLPQDARVEVIADRIEWHPTGATEPFVLDIEEFFRRALDA